ncbi:LysR family transcriptional regulator [Lysinibacter cavernae]|uniref:DNA-binding transcriptional LysR family regulator n=1 Tax=Lysinibacter cavernae TaxID=1640652 RepID=A0A7X5QZG9_9MICO|nr:LysR family transcriptional regulator [Lysinibacter cavernae]NIH52655.1 DNA-binding transcriptional LysR family regulator [Lysinibacter cavernae]
MTDPSWSSPSPNDLMILLAVARLGRFNAVADALETTHTTVSRRIQALDQQLGGRTLVRSPHGWELTDLGAEAVRAAEAIELSLGSLTRTITKDSDAITGLVRLSSPDGFAARCVSPALVALQRKHPRLNVEVMSGTKRINQNRSGVDLELVVEPTDVPNVHTLFLSNYYLRLYASREYLEGNGTPESTADLRHHAFVSYVESALQVAELGHRSTGLPDPRSSLQSTSIFAQVEAVRSGGGIGLLPSFLIADDDDFVPVLSSQFHRKLRIMAAARPESLRSPAVQATISAIKQQVAESQELLLG